MSALGHKRTFVNREVLVLQLKVLGIVADGAVSGADALKAWGRNHYAAVLVDIHMPRMDGHELTRQLRAFEANRDGARTPIIAVTADAMKNEEERCFASGMDGYLVKPVSIERLGATERSRTGGRRQRGCCRRCRARAGRQGR